MARTVELEPTTLLVDTDDFLAAAKATLKNRVSAVLARLLFLAPRAQMHEPIHSRGGY